MTYQRLIRYTQSTEKKCHEADG